MVVASTLAFLTFHHIKCSNKMSAQAHKLQRKLLIALCVQVGHINILIDNPNFHLGIDSRILCVHSLSNDIQLSSSETVNNHRARLMRAADDSVSRRRRPSHHFAHYWLSAGNNANVEAADNWAEPCTNEQLRFQRSIEYCDRDFDIKNMKLFDLQKHVSKNNSWKCQHSHSMHQWNADCSRQLWHKSGNNMLMFYKYIQCISLSHLFR